MSGVTGTIFKHWAPHEPLRGACKRLRLPGMLLGRFMHVHV